MQQNSGGGGIFLLSALLLAGLAACGGDEPTAVRVPAAPAQASFQPQLVEVTLGASGEKVTLMTTQDGGFTLNGEAFESGKTVTSESGNVYTLLLADGAWNARYDAHEVEVKLGSQETVKLVKGEDGGYMLGEMAVESGVTKHTSANGNVYTLVMGEDGMWMAQYQASETMLALGTSGTTVTIVKNEDGTYTVGGEPLMSGGTWTAGNGGEYTLAMGEDGKWTATYVPGKGTVTVGGTDLTLVATRAEDGTWSVVNPVTGETESLSEGGQITTAGNTYTLTSDGGGKWTATYNPMRVEVQLGTIGGTVTLMRAEDGSYWLGEMQVEAGVTPVTSENGNRYTLVMGEDGTWMGRYEAPTTTVTLGTSGTMVTIVMQEDGSWTLDGEVFMSGGQHTAGNGNVYRLSRVDGVWMAEYVPMTMEVRGTGGLQAVKREDGTGYDVDGALLGMEGMGDIETETSGWYRVVMQDGALMGTRLDNVAIGKAKFKTKGVSAHPSILQDDRKTEANEARTALAVVGENYPFGDLLGDGVSQTKGKNFVAEARGKLLEIREKIVAVLDVFDTDSQRDTQVGRQWGTESANNARTNVKGVLETVFGKNNVKGKYAARRPDDDDALGVIDDLIEALGSAEALQKALGDEDLLKGSAAASAAGKIFAAAETESTVTYGEHGNTRFGTITRTKRTDAVGDLKYDGDTTPQTGERGAFAFGVTGETSRTRYVQTTGTARYEGRTLAVSGAGKHYSGDIEVSVNFNSQKVDGLITDLATSNGEPWEYLFGDVDTIVLPKANMNLRGIWKQRTGSNKDLASITFGQRAGAYRPQTVSSTFEGRLLGGNSSPGAGSEIVGVWSLGADTESKSYLAGGFGAHRTDDDTRLPSDDGSKALTQLRYPRAVTTGQYGGMDLQDGKAKITVFKWDWIPGDGDMAYSPNPNENGNPTANSKTQEAEFSLTDLFARGPEEHTVAEGPRHIETARTAIEAAKKRLNALIDLDLPEEEQAKQWKLVQNTVRSILFTDGSANALSQTRLGGTYQKNDALPLIDDVLAALQSPEALGDALSKGEGGIFTYSGDPTGAKAVGDPLTDKSVAELWSEPKWQVLAALDSTTYTRFGVWRVRFSKNAERNGGWQGEAVTSRSFFGYSMLEPAVLTSFDSPNAPSQTTARYVGGTVAWFSNADHRTGRTPGVVNEKSTLYTGRVEVGVDWNPVSNNDLGKMSVMIDHLMTAEGNYFRHDDGAAGSGKEVRSIDFSDISIRRNSRSNIDFPADIDENPKVVIRYVDSSQSLYRVPDAHQPTFSQGIFAGTAPDYPLAVLGLWQVSIQEEGNPGRGILEGAFGAEVP